MYQDLRLERESVRERDIVDAIEKSGVAFREIFDTKIRYSIATETSGEAEVLAVVCPLVSQEMSNSEQALEGRCYRRGERRRITATGDRGSVWKMAR